MPLWLLKVLPYGAAALALIAAVWYIDHRGYERAEAQNAALQAKLDAQEKSLELKVDGDVETSQISMGRSMDQLGQQLNTQIGSIETTDKTIIQPTITKEIASDPHLTSADCTMSDSLRQSINKARGLGQSAHSAGPEPTGVSRVPADPAAQ